MISLKDINIPLHSYIEQQHNEEAVKLASSGLSTWSERQLLSFLISIIDLTTLEGNDTDEKVAALCNKGKAFSTKYSDIPNVAAICVYPTLVLTAKRELTGTDIHVASVAGAFPAGQSPLSIKIEEVKYAIEQGADEIDMVISRGKLLEGKYQEVFDEIYAIKQACGKTHLKVILETGELTSLSNIRLASDIAIAAGANFIKTSTGKIGIGATLDAMLIMLQAIKDHYKKTGNKIGIKPAGGISDIETAKQYINLVQNILGNEWMNKYLFRIGASRLIDRIIEQL